jgi:hypothetical protein
MRPDVILSTSKVLSRGCTLSACVINPTTDGWLIVSHRRWPGNAYPHRRGRKNAPYEHRGRFSIAVSTRVSVAAHCAGRTGMHLAFGVVDMAFGFQTSVGSASMS